jgi:hypothetical protein
MFLNYVLDSAEKLQTVLWIKFNPKWVAGGCIRLPKL